MTAPQPDRAGQEGVSDKCADRECGRCRDGVACAHPCHDRQRAFVPLWESAQQLSQPPTEHHVREAIGYVEAAQRRVWFNQEAVGKASALDLATAAVSVLLDAGWRQCADQIRAGSNIIREVPS